MNPDRLTATCRNYKCLIHGLKKQEKCIEEFQIIHDGVQNRLPLTNKLQKFKLSRKLMKKLTPCGQRENKRERIKKIRAETKERERSS